MTQKHMVTVFLERQGKILLMRRSDSAQRYQGKWAGVLMSVSGCSPLTQAMQGVEHETGLKGSDVRFVKAGPEFEVKDPRPGTLWIVHPFLFEALCLDRFQLDGTYCDHKWIRPSDLELFETVPLLKKSLSRVL